MNPTLKELRAQLQAAKDAEIAASGDLMAAAQGSTEAAAANKRMKEAAAKKREVEQAIADMEGAEVPAAGDLTADQRSLARRASVGNLIRAAVNDARPEGVEAELLSELGMPERGANGGTMIPFALMEREVQNVDAPTSVPDTVEGPVRQRNVIERVWSRSVGSFLGCRMESVAMGTASYLTLTAGVATPAPVAKDATKDSEAATISGVELTPKRISAAYTLDVTDLARIADLESALRRDLNSAIQDATDVQVISGSGAGVNFAGFLGAAGIAAPTTASAVATYGDYAALASNGVEGRFAEMESSVRILAHPDVLKHAAGIIAANGSMTALQALRSAAGAFRVSANMPAPTVATGPNSTKSDVLMYRTGGRGGPDCVAAVWGNGMEIIRSRFEGAAQGRIRLTAILLADFAITRAAAYLRHNVQIA